MKSPLDRLVECLDASLADLKKRYQREGYPEREVVYDIIIETFSGLRAALMVPQEPAPGEGEYPYGELIGVEGCARVRKLRALPEGTWLNWSRGAEAFEDEFNFPPLDYHLGRERNRVDYLVNSNGMGCVRASCQCRGTTYYVEEHTT